MKKESIRFILRPDENWMGGYSYDLDAGGSIGVKFQYNSSAGLIRVVKYGYLPEYTIYKVEELYLREIEGIDRVYLKGEPVVKIKFSDPTFTEYNPEEYRKLFIEEFGADPVDENMEIIIEEILREGV